MARAQASGRSFLNIMKHMKGVKFPADKNQLLNLVEQNRSRSQDTDMVKEVIEKIPEKDYGSVSEIVKETNKI